jgi:hypothetical protein
MAKFRKKPVVVEAITFDELVDYGKVSGTSLVNDMPWSFEYAGQPITHENDDCYLIPTPEGIMKFERGDMLITGVRGEIYPCTMDIFQKNYDPADSETFRDRVRKELYFGMGCEGYADLAFAGMWVSRRLSNGDLSPTYCVMQDYAEPLTDELRSEIAESLIRLADIARGEQGDSAHNVVEIKRMREVIKKLVAERSDDDWHEWSCNSSHGTGLPCDCGGDELKATVFEMIREG